jgi:aminoglycoside phosphotransferase (APT) family kinase protein
MGNEADGLPAELATWVEATLDGTIVAVRRQARWRPTYFIDVDAPGVSTVVLKSARAPKKVIERSALLSTFNTDREALVLEWLGGHDLHDLAVPPFLGFHEESGSLLMARLDGSAQMHDVDDDVQLRAISDDFATQLAELHRLDVEPLVAATSLRIPTSPEDLALGNFLRYAEADLDTVRSKRPTLTDPLLTLAGDWAHRRFPDGERGACLVQGDCGPDQFLFVGGRVSAIIDWELAHIGDPMVDLGAMRLRECIYPAGMFPLVLERYRALGMPVDEQAIRYYTVVTILFTLFGTFGGAVRLDPRNDEVIQQLWWQVSLRRALCEAIAEWEGIALSEPDPLEPVDSSESRRQQLLADRLDELARRGDDWASRLRPTMALADAIANDRLLAPAREAGDLADLGAALGAPVDDVEDAKRRLEQHIVAGGTDRFELHLQVLYNLAVREQVAWLPLWGSDRWTDDDAAGDRMQRGEEQRGGQVALGLTPIDVPQRPIAR